MKEIQDKKITEDKKNLTETVKKYIVPCILLVILAVIVSWITFIRVKTQIAVGPGWDTFAFLANALEFAGKGIGYSELERPPFLSFLTAIPFSLGDISQSIIYYVDGLLFIFGIIGLYLLLKTRFDSILSFFGCVLFISFPIVLTWVGTGYSDIGSVSLTIWAVYMTVLAVKNDSKFYYLVFPLLMLSFLTRFTQALILFPIVLYIIISGEYLQNIKKILMGIIISILMLIPYTLSLYKTYGDPFYFLGAFTATEATTTEHFAYNPDIFYFITKIPNFISSENLNWLVYVILFIVIIGIVIYFFDLIKKIITKTRIKKQVQEALNFKVINTKINLIIFGLLLVLFIITLSKVSYTVSELIFFFFCYSTYVLLKKFQIKDIELDILFFSWFMSFFIFHSVFAIKVDRYFITMAPAFIYFVVLGLNKIVNKLKFSVKTINITSVLLSLILSILLIFSAFSFASGMPVSEDYLVNDTAQASNWLKIHDPDYNSKIIYSEIWPAVSWDLKTDVKPMPTFNDSRAYKHLLEKYNVDYYFDIHGGKNLTSYDKIAQFGTVSIYQKNESKFEEKPKMLYIGRNWENYVENVLDFRSFVLSEKTIYSFSNSSAERVYGSQKSLFIDEHSLDEFKQYDAVLLYNFGYHDQKKAESLIYNYTNSGGTVVIDASRNLDGVYYNLDNSVFLNTFIVRKDMAINPKIWISPKLSNDSFTFSQFTSDGETWYGADYSPFGNNTIENLVTADGKTLIAVQKVGKGRIIWIGYNFVWHAFHLDNDNEKKLIQKAIFGS